MELLDELAELQESDASIHGMIGFMHHTISRFGVARHAF
jgi:hypothetical protein